MLKSKFKIIKFRIYVAGKIRSQVEFVLTLVKLVIPIFPSLNTHSLDEKIDLLEFAN